HCSLCVGHRDVPSSPTRRSSDLGSAGISGGSRGRVCGSDTRHPSKIGKATLISVRHTLGVHVKLLRIAASAAAAALLAATLSACGSSDEASGTNEDTVTVEHAQGETEVPVNPDSVLTFDIASLDTMDALGVGAVTGVPKDSLPDYLDKYGSDDYTNIGTLFEPDYEAIPATEPDLIIVAGRSADAYDDLAEDFTVIDLTMDSTDYSASLEDRTETLASIFDVEEQAGDALEKLQQRTEAIKDAAGDQGTGLVLLTSGGKVTAFGTGSRYDWIHSAFGVEPAVENVKHEG